LQPEFEAGLHDAEPLHCLRERVRSLLVEGYSRQGLIAELERFRIVLQDAGREADEDVVLEVLDFLHGWCAPHMRV
jgi:hypothetical protein